MIRLCAEIKSRIDAARTAPGTTVTRPGGASVVVNLSRIRDVRIMAQDEEWPRTADYPFVLVRPMPRRLTAYPSEVRDEALQVEIVVVSKAAKREVAIQGEAARLAQGSDRGTGLSDWAKDVERLLDDYRFLTELGADYFETAFLDQVGAVEVIDQDDRAFVFAVRITMNYTRQARD